MVEERRGAFFERTGGLSEWAAQHFSSGRGLVNPQRVGSSTVATSESTFDTLVTALLPQLGRFPSFPGAPRPAPVHYTHSSSGATLLPRNRSGTLHAQTHLGTQYAKTHAQTHSTHKHTSAHSTHKHTSELKRGKSTE